MPEQLTRLTRHKADLMLAAEHEVINKLMDELRNETAVVPRSNIKAWIQRIKDRFEHFEAHKIKHMALEEQGGYLAPVLESRPVLSKEVARLQHDHDELMRMMRSIRDQAAGLQENDCMMIRDWCRRLSQLFCCIEQHEREEDLILIDAVSRDIGVKD